MNLTTYLRLLPLTEKCLLPFLLRRLIPSKIPLLPHLLNHLLIDPFQLHLRTRSDNVSRIYSSEWYAIDFEGAGDEKHALWEVLEEDDALAAETAGEEDEDAAGLEGVARAGGVDGFADLDGDC